MPKGMTAAAKKASAYVAKHPGEMNAEQIAKKFGLHPSTVYRSEWWKSRDKTASVVTDPPVSAQAERAKIKAQERSMGKLGDAIFRHRLTDE